MCRSTTVQCIYMYMYSVRVHHPMHAYCLWANHLFCCLFTMIPIILESNRYCSLFFNPIIIRFHSLLLKIFLYRSLPWNNEEIRAHSCQGTCRYMCSMARNKCASINQSVSWWIMNWSRLCPAWWLSGLITLFVAISSNTSLLSRTCTHTHTNQEFPC